jgi:hypothetical protein
VGDDSDVAVMALLLPSRTERISASGTAGRLSFLVIAVLLSPAGAQAGGKRIGVPQFEGAREAPVRKKVMQLLESHGFEPVDSLDIQEATVLSGTGLDTEDDLKALAKNLALSAIVTGEVGATRAKIVVHDGFDGSILGDASFAGASPRNLTNDVELTFWKKVGPDVERGHVPTGAKKVQKRSEEPAADGDDRNAESKNNDEPGLRKKQKRNGKPRFRMEDEPKDEALATSAPLEIPWLDIELGFGGLNRSLTFTQNVVVRGSALLLPYALGVGPIGVANLVAYPWLKEEVGNLGVEAEIQQGFGISSMLTNGGSLSDAVHDYSGGFRYRVLFANNDDLFFSLRLGEDAFTFNGTARASLALLDTVYHYVRAGAGMHLAISDAIGVSFGGGYRDITNSAGPQMAHFFPRLTVAGADADLVGRYALSEMVELRVGVEWRRYWYAMHSQPGDQIVAGGAIDQSFAFTARIAVALGTTSAHKPAGSTQEAPSPPPPKPRARRGSSGNEKGDEDDSDSGPARPSADADDARKSGGSDDE